MANTADIADIKVPVFPESIDEGTIARWHKKEGESFHRDEPLVDVETDKIVLEVPAPSSGVITSILAAEGATVKAQQVIANYEKTKEAKETKEMKKTNTEPNSQDTGTAKGKKSPTKSGTIESAPQEKVAKSPEPKTTENPASYAAATKTDETRIDGKLAGKMGPAARRMAAETGVEVETHNQGPFITKQDIAQQGGHQRIEKRVPMTRLRMSVAKRLVESQRQAAILTTFNEVNMQPVMELRTRYKKPFEEKYGVRLGFMSFFVKAVCSALYKFPQVNAHIDGTDIVYCNYQDIGIAVSSPRGLVVPILRDAQSMLLAQIEKAIRGYGEKAQEAKLTLEDLQGGTFTISNGGVFGSLMSTPIINPPQTGILGMHKIQERPVAVNGEVVILPMMYLALSYDHRMIDGKTAVEFLVHIKEFLEYPGMTLLGL